MTVVEDQALVRISGHNTVTKRLGHWTTERRFEVRAHRGYAVLDLRSPRIPDGDIEIDVTSTTAWSSCSCPRTR